MEDMTPMQFLPAAANSHGYVAAGTIMEMWKERFNFLYHEHDEDAGESEGGTGGFLFPLVLHPDTSGMAHVIGMVDRMIGWLQARGEEVEFCRYEDVARDFKAKQGI
jgi:hypothetical protein